MDDWAMEIVKGARAHERIRELDRTGLWQHCLPEVAASEDEIAATEMRLGFQLDPQYRGFLRFQAVDRFPGFDEFYLAMLDYNREEVRDLEQGR